MKKFLWILVLSLILINQKIEASQSNEIKLKSIRINTQDQQYYKIGSDIRGRVEGMEWINRFFVYTEDNKLKGLIEIFTFDNTGQRGEGQINRWFRSRTFQRNDERGCIESDKKIFFKVIDHQITIACLSVRKIKSDELASPNFNKAEYVPLSRREGIIMKFINKQNLVIPDEMLRAEHYFYKAGKINWILFSFDTDVNSEKHINKFINQTFQNHQKFENQLKLNHSVRFDFTEKPKITKKTKKEEKKKEPKKKKKKEPKKKTTSSSDLAAQIKELKQLLDDGIITEEEFTKAKKKLLD